jgi:membrane associated rhomboid family serine protease
LGLPTGFDPGSATPSDRASAIAILQHADDLAAQSEFEQALALYTRVTGVPDRDVAAAACYGSGNALYRLDREVEARQAWETATRFGETPVTYRAWRQVAAALVREGKLPEALDAYRQCERRAPQQDRAEIASRLGWLSKETGNTGAAGRYFARSRGDALRPFMTYLIIAATVVTSLVAMQGSHSIFGQYINSPLETALMLDKLGIAHGEWYRLLTVTLVHDPTFLPHLLLNMYALWFAGQLVERMYGSALMLFLYVVCGIAASIASYVFGDSVQAVGASGAIFGMFGVVLAATRFHHPVLDQQSRSIASQMGVLIVLNLILGFTIPGIDYTAHIGGLIAGLWLGLIIPPTHVQTLRSIWQQQRTTTSPATIYAARGLGIAALVAVMGVGMIVGTDKWQNDPAYPFYYQTARPGGLAIAADVDLPAAAAQTGLLYR